MNEKRAKREQDKIREVARDYQKRGYVVMIEPHLDVLPDFINDLDYRPDMIVKSEDGNNIIIEVKTSSNLKESAKKLAKLSDALKTQKNWEFELILTNPRRNEEQKRSTVEFDFGEFRNVFERVERLLSNSEMYDAALLLGWSAVEGIIRATLSREGADVRPRTPRTLIRDAAILGLIPREEIEFLEQVSDTRNKLAHGDFGAEISETNIHRLLTIGNSLLSQLKGDSIS